MNKLKHYITASAGLVLFISVIAFSLPQTGHSSSMTPPPDRDVRVINVETEAIPVRGSVRAQQQGTWTVGIAGTPTVEVGNTEASPVFTRDVDRATAQPFKVSGLITLDTGIGGQNAFTLIPAGKILVVEHVSAWGSVAPDQEIEQFSILGRIIPDNVLRPHFLNDEKRTYATAVTHTVSESVRIYAEGSVGFRVTRRTPNGLVAFTYTISGYLVDK